MNQDEQIQVEDLIALQERLAENEGQPFEADIIAWSEAIQADFLKKEK